MKNGHGRSSATVRVLHYSAEVLDPGRPRSELQGPKGAVSACGYGALVRDLLHQPGPVPGRAVAQAARALRRVRVARHGPPERRLGRLWAAHRNAAGLNVRCTFPSTVAR